jgi:hypothetical protein
VLFDGRIAEDFKLRPAPSSASARCPKVVTMGAPCVQDVVVTGLNRDEVGLLIFPRTDSCRALAGLAADVPLPEVLHSAPLRTFFQDLADRLWRAGSGSANRPARLHVMAEPPSIDKGEVTDKGSINQRAVLTHRAALVEALTRAAIRPLPDPPEQGQGMNMQGQSALVTGSGSGLGEGGRPRLSRLGANVAVLGVNPAAHGALAADVNGIATTPATSADSASVTAALDAATAAHSAAHRDEHRRIGTASADRTARPHRWRFRTRGAHQPDRHLSNSGWRPRAHRACRPMANAVDAVTASVAAFDVGQPEASSAGGWSAALPRRGPAQYGVRVVQRRVVPHALMATCPTGAKSLAASIPSPGWETRGVRGAGSAYRHQRPSAG